MFVGEAPVVIEIFASTMKPSISPTELHFSRGRWGMCAQHSGLNAERTIFFHNFFKCPQGLLATIVAALDIITYLQLIPMLLS